MALDDIDDPPVQRTQGRWVTLRPVRPADYDAIRAAELSDDLGVRWRYRGATPSPDAFVQTLWSGVLAQFLVVTNSDHRLLGLVSAYDPDLRSGTCFVGFARFGPPDGSPGLVEGVLLLVDHLFTHWPFRKLYGETIEFNLPNLGVVLGPLLIEEGRLRQHVFAGGRHWDLCHLALYRSTWTANRERLLPPPDRGSPDDPGPAPALVTVTVPGRPT